jgi:hypothetical protein
MNTPSPIPTSTPPSTRNFNDYPPAVRAKAMVRYRLHADPASLLAMAGMAADPWQESVLRSPAPRLLLLCSRGAGKSTVSAALSLLTVLREPDSLVLILSPSERQSGEIFRTAGLFYDALRRPVATLKRTELQLHLGNGSRLIALPDNERTVRTYQGVRLLVVDEAARADDDLYYTVRPMLAVSRGRIVLLSTPFGQRGFFWEEWERGQGWERYPVRADECPRISPEFLADEGASMGPRWFKQEYELSFESAAGAVFAPETIRGAMRDEVTPLF